MCGGGEVFQNLSPSGIVGRAATMTLINNDQIEAIRAKINGCPTMQWVNDCNKKLNYIKFS